MKTIKGWNIFRADDAYKSLGDNLLKLATAGSITTNDMIEVIEGNTSPNDGIFGDRTLEAIGTYPKAFEETLGLTSMASATINLDYVTTSSISVKPLVRNLKPFKCPCCGGNSYSNKNGSIICDYCGTMFTENIR